MTEVSGTQGNSSFFNKIGQSIKKGWNNGNIQKGITAAGMTAFTVGFTGAMIHDMNNRRGCCGGGSIWAGMLGTGCNYPIGMNLLGGNLFGMGNMTGMFNPMSYMGTGMGMTGMPMTGMNMGMMGLTGGMDPYAYGRMYMEQLNAQNPGTQATGNSNSATGGIAGLKKQNNEYAGKWDADQSTVNGKTFDEGTAKMVDKDGAPVDGKKIILSDNENKEEYKKDLSGIAKSFAAYMEKNSSGTVDQELTMEEYINYELSRLPSNATEEEKQNIRNGAKIAFSRMDLNQDGKADWKEIAAAMATIDTDSEGKQDGQFNSTDYVNWSKAMIDPKTSTFSDTLTKNYKNLFGGEE